MTAEDIRIVDATSGQPVDVVIPGQQVQVQVTLAPGQDAPSSFDVKVTSDKGTATITVTRMEHTGDANPTYQSAPTDIGHGPVIEGYAGKKGPLDRLDIGSGAGVNFSAGGSATDVVWYPTELAAKLGELETQLTVFDTYLTWAEIGLKNAPDTPKVREARELARRKRAIIQALKAQLADPRNWQRGLMYMLQRGIPVLNARHAEDIDLVQVLSAFGNDLRRGAEEGKAIVQQGFNELTLVFYEQLVGATGAGDVWTLVFGQDIFGNDVDAKARFDAAVSIAFQAAMMAIPIWHMSRYRVARTTRRIARPTPPRPVAGVKPTKAPPGTHVHPTEFGMLPEGARHVNRVAEANGVIITVRPTNPEAMKWRELGYPGKPMEIKAKTVNTLDVALGARAEDIGLVAYFEPTQPVRTPEMSDADWAKVQTRYDDRVTEFKLNEKKMEHLVHEGQIRIDEHGVVIDTGICGGTGKPITGDYDLWDVTLPDGTPVRGTDLELITNQLRFGGYGAQHGPHKAWVIDPKHPMYVKDPDLLKGHQKVDADIKAKHAVGGSDPEAVIQFGGYSKRPVTVYEGAPYTPVASGPWMPGPELGTALSSGSQFRPFIRPWIFLTPRPDGQPHLGSGFDTRVQLVPLTPLVPVTPAAATPAAPAAQHEPDASAGSLVGERPEYDDELLDQVPPGLMNPEARERQWQRMVASTSKPYARIAAAVVIGLAVVGGAFAFARSSTAVSSAAAAASPTSVRATTSTAIASSTPAAATPSAGASAPTAASLGYQCTGPQVKIFDNWNGGGVSVGGAPVKFSTNGKTYCLAWVATYHWNGGKGAIPGRIGLVGANGSYSGQAVGTDGQGGVPDANWIATPPAGSQPLLSGEYTCTDSDPATWAQNDASQHLGFCRVWATEATK